MVDEVSAAMRDDRSADIAHGTLLTHVQEGLAPGSHPGTRTRRCPCCGREIRAGERITTIHGTSVHVRCANDDRR